MGGMCVTVIKCGRVGVVRGNNECVYGVCIQIN